MVKTTFTSDLPYTLENVMIALSKFMPPHSDRQFSSFTIMGYGYLETYAKFHYDDCEEIVKLKYNGTKPMTIEFEYTENYDSTNNNNHSRASQAKHYAAGYKEIQKYIPEPTKMKEFNPEAFYSEDEIIIHTENNTIITSDNNTYREYYKGSFNQVFSNKEHLNKNYPNLNTDILNIN
jgi:hypothetical protein